MFGLFKKQPKIDFISKGDIGWVEDNLIWFIEGFGLDRIRKHPFLFPDYHTFPYTDLNNNEQFEKLIAQLSEIIELNRESIEVVFFDDLFAKEWITWGPVGPASTASSVHLRLMNETGAKFRIELAKSNLKHPQLLVSVLARELVRTKLIREYLLNPSLDNSEPFLDLATIFFGFGILTANSFMTNEINWINRHGFLPIEITSYANGLICYLADLNPKEIERHFNLNGRDLFLRSSQFLNESKDTTLTKEMIHLCDTKHRINKGSSKAFEEMDFEKVHKLNAELIQLEPENVIAFNNIGYAFMKQRDYLNAIGAFTKSIGVDPYFDYAFNNRGYCKLNIMDLDGGLNDIETALQMDNSNAFAHRNLGLYYFLSKEFGKALESYDRSIKLDDDTELIHFLSSKAFEAVGDFENAKAHFEKSRLKNEYNDSIVE
jgi:tetratricopeptide (TPR) repeat protein